MVFGDAVDSGVELGHIEPENVFHYLKHTTLDDYAVDETDVVRFQNLDPLLQSAKKQHNLLLEKIETTYGGKVNIENVLTGKDFQRKIFDMSDVLAAFHGFLYRSAQQEVVSFLGVEHCYKTSGRDCELVQELQEMCRHEAQLVVSTPATSTNMTQDRLLDILDKAVPKELAVSIVSEGDAACNYLINEENLPGQQVTDKDGFVLVDMGGMTLDGGGARRYFEDGQVKVVRSFQSMVDFNGSLKMGAISIKQIESRSPAGWKSLLASVEPSTKKVTPKTRKSTNVVEPISEKFVLEISESFEVASRAFDNTGKEWPAKFVNHSKVDMVNLRIPRQLRPHITFRRDEENEDDPDSWEVGFSTELVKDVFDEWLPSVDAALLSMISKHRETFPKTTPRVVLCGRASSPSYVRQSCQRQLSLVEPSITIEYLESLTNPLVAHGGFIMADDGGIFASEARNSYGLRQDIPLASISIDAGYHREAGLNRSTCREFLLDRVRWGVEKGAILANRDKPIILEAKKVFNLNIKKGTSPFPLKWRLELFVSGHPQVLGADRYRPIENAVNDGHIVSVGVKTLVITKSNYEIDVEHFEKKDNPIKETRVAFRYRTEICLDGVQPQMVISLIKKRPKVGKSAATEEWSQVESFPLVSLLTHATTRRLKRAQEAAGCPVDPTLDALETGLLNLDLDLHEEVRT